MQIYPTATLKHLAQKKLLGEYLLVPAVSKETVTRRLKSLLASSNGLPEIEFDAAWLEDLERHFLITRSPDPLPKPGLPFAFVTAINFELTYGCNLACKHCLQDSLRPQGLIPWIDSSIVTAAFEDGSWLKLFKRGVNLTGGEIYLPGSPILELLAKAKALGIPVRSNTNAWWGGRRNFKVGNAQFDSDAQLVERLIGDGLAMLALSLDERYSQYPELFDRVMRVAELCETGGLQYQFVATDASESMLTQVVEDLTQRIGGALRHLLLERMDTVDLGAASGDGDSSLEPETLANLTRNTPCGRKGFYRPYFLHVNPDGGLRSCLYAPGASVLGNLSNERLPEILNRADRNPVVRLFEGGSLEDFVERFVTPWSYVYRGVLHPCSASALIARVGGSVAESMDSLNRDLKPSEMENLHQTIARELSIGANVSK